MDIPVSLVRKDCLESKVLRETAVGQETMEFPDLQDQWVQWASLVRMANRDLLGREAYVERKDPWDRLDSRVL